MVTIKRYSGGFYLVTLENGGGIKVHEKRLFHTKEDDTKHIRSISSSHREELPDNALPNTLSPNLKSASAMYKIKIIKKLATYLVMQQASLLFRIF